MGGSTPQTTQTTGKPPPWLDKIFQTAGGDALAAYKKGYGAGPYPGNTVAGWSPQTLQAMQMMQQTATGANPLLGHALGAENNLLSGNGLGAGGTVATNALKGIAGGQYTGAANPYLKNIIGQTDSSVGNQINLAASGAGRYGSDSHLSALSSGLGAAENQLRYQDYDTALNRQMTAASQLGDLANSGAQNQLRAEALAPSINQMRYADANQLGQIGGMYDQKAQQYLNADIAQYNADRSAPYTAIQSLLGSLNGISGYQNATQTMTPATNPWMQSLGGGLGGATVGGMFGGPTGALLGGMGGMLFPWL